MDWEILSILLCINAIFGLIFALIFLYRDKEYKNKIVDKVMDALAMILLICTLPGSMIVAFPMKILEERAMKRRRETLWKLRAVAECRQKPSDWQITTYGFECEMFVDANGKFDLYEWKSHEYEKIGL